MIDIIWEWTNPYPRSWDIQYAFKTKNKMYFGITFDGVLICNNQKYLDRVYDISHWDFESRRLWTVIYDD